MMLNFLQFNGKNLPCLSQKCCTFLLKPCKSIKKLSRGPHQSLAMSHSLPVPSSPADSLFCHHRCPGLPIGQSVLWGQPAHSSPADSWLGHMVDTPVNTYLELRKLRTRNFHIQTGTLSLLQITDSNCDLFLDKLYMYYSSFPKMTKTLTSKRLQKPFRVSLTIRFKFYLYKQYKLSNIPFDNYKEYRNHLNISIKVESIFFQQKFTNFRNKIKKVEKSSKK